MNEAQAWTVVIGLLGVFLLQGAVLLWLVRVRIRSVLDSLDELDRKLDRLGGHLQQLRSALG